MARQACVDCHFFIKDWRDTRPTTIFVVTEAERRACRNRDFSWHDEVKAPVALACYMGVWDQGVGEFDKGKRYELVVENERRGFCFFWRHRPGMLLGAAKELQEREMAADEARQDRRLILVGLWIAALALLADVVLQLVKSP